MIPQNGCLRLEEVLGTKVPWRVLRILLRRPYLTFTPTALAEGLGTSRASVLRGLKPLVVAGVVRADGGRYRVNAEQPLAKALWRLFVLERVRNMQPEFGNAVELFFSAVEQQVSVFIVFGSVARGLATAESDIDIAVVGDGVAERRFDFLPYRFDVHTYTHDQLTQPADFVALDALLNGIPLAGQNFVLDVLKELRFFPRPYLLYRLNRVRWFRQRAAELEGEAGQYYTTLADVALREIESVLRRGTPVSRAEFEGTGADVDEIEVALAQEGERIWLT